MDRDLHHQTVQRALELGRGTDPAALPELIPLLRFPSTEVRRLAAPAIAKLAPFGADPDVAIPALLPVALRDPHRQVQQYALKALKNFGHHAAPHLPDLDDLTQNEETATLSTGRQAPHLHLSTRQTPHRHDSPP